MFENLGKDGIMNYLSAKLDVRFSTCVCAMDKVAPGGRIKCYKKQISNLTEKEWQLREVVAFCYDSNILDYDEYSFFMDYLSDSASEMKERLWVMYFEGDDVVF